MLWAFHSQGNFSLTWENFKLVSQRKEKPFVFPPITTGEGVGGGALASEG